MGDNMEKEIWERLTAAEQSCKSAHHRIDSIEKLTESVHILAVETKAMREDLSEVKGRVDTIEGRPAKRWDLVVTTIITAITSGVVGFVISNFIR